MGLGLLGTTFGEAGLDAMIGGSALTGPLAPELIGAEIALMGMIVGIKKLKQHHQNKKQRQEDQRNAQRQAEEEKQRQEDEYQAELQRQRQAEEQKRQEEERQRQEDERRRQEEEAKRQADEQQRQLEEEAKRQREEDQRIQQQRQQRYQQASNDLIQERNARIRQMEQEQGVDVNIQGYPGDSDLPWIARYIFPPSMLQNDRQPDEQWYIPPNVPDGGPDNDPNGNDGGPGGNPNDPNNPDDNDNFDPFGNNNQRNNQGWRYDPFKDIIDAMGRQISKNVDRSRKQKEQQESENYPGKNGSGTYQGDQQDEYPGKNGSGTYKPEYWTDEYKQQNPDKVKQAEAQNQDQPHVDYTNDLQTMEYQMMGLMEGLSQNELTMEQSFVEMEKIEQTLKQKIPEKVRIQPTQIYSSTLARF